MSREDVLRERARTMVADELNDAQIDQSIMYSDLDIRLEIWGYVHEYREASQVVANGRTAPNDVAGAVTPVNTTPGRPGRPAWTADLFWERYQDAMTDLKRPSTYGAIADQFVALDGTRGIDPDYLRRLLRRFRRLGDAEAE